MPKGHKVKHLIHKSWYIQKKISSVYGKLTTKVRVSNLMILLTVQLHGEYLKLQEFVIFTKYATRFLLQLVQMMRKNLIQKTEKMKNNPKATTIEQSRKLLELGLDPKSADFAWVGEDGCFVKSSSDEVEDTETPAWSLEALIDALPSGTAFISKGRLVYSISFRKGGGGDENFVSTSYSKSLINQVFELVVWMFENGYMQKGVLKD